jgi:hypothetical protein
MPRLFPHFPHGADLRLHEAAAPEPSEIGMLALIALGLGGLMLRAKKRAAL